VQPVMQLLHLPSFSLALQSPRDVIARYPGATALSGDRAEPSEEEVMALTDTPVSASMNSFSSPRRAREEVRGSLIGRTRSPCPTMITGRFSGSSLVAYFRFSGEEQE
jgi:hypothetical protein